MSSYTHPNASVNSLDPFALVLVDSTDEPEHSPKRVTTENHSPIKPKPASKSTPRRVLQPRQPQPCHSRQIQIAGSSKSLLSYLNTFLLVFLISVPFRHKTPNTPHQISLKKQVFTVSPFLCPSFPASSSPRFPNRPQDKRIEPTSGANRDKNFPSRVSKTGPRQSPRTTPRSSPLFKLLTSKYYQTLNMIKGVAVLF